MGKQEEMTVAWTQKRGRKTTSYQKLSLNESSPRENKFKWKFNKGHCIKEAKSPGE